MVKITGFYTGEPVTLKRISRTISAIGKKAGAVVHKAEGKYASAHDLRRSIGTRWASRVKPATLQLLMRHRSIATTLKYYVDQDADDVADELWKAHAGFGNSLGTPPENGQERRKGFRQRIDGTPYGISTFYSGGHGIEPATPCGAQHFQLGVETLARPQWSHETRANPSLVFHSLNCPTIAAGLHMHATHATPR